MAQEPDGLHVVDRYNEKTSLRDLWKNSPGFLVCGGPSLRALDLGFLRCRGVVSLGVNNVAGLAPVSAWTFSDPPEKFHHGVHLDPGCLSFVPIPKLRKKIRVKQPDGGWVYPGARVRDCPGVVGYERSCEFRPETFLTSRGATWGNNDKGVQATGGPKLLFSMFLGIRLLHYLGVRRVYMLGVDFGMDPLGDANEQYAFGQRREPGACETNNGSYIQAAKWLAELRPIFDAAGFNLFNCNPSSRLEVFDHVPYEDAILDATRHCREPFDLSGWYEKKPKHDTAKETAGSLSRRERRRLRRIQRRERLDKAESRKG